MNEAEPKTRGGTRPEAAAWALMNSGRYDEADRAFRRLLDDDPGSSAVWNGIGLVAYRQKRLEAAERAFRKALSIDPRRPDTKHYLAIVLRALGRTDEALQLFEAVRETFADDAVFLSNFGNALVAAKRSDEGVKVLMRAVALSPDSDLFRINLAKALIEAKRADEAVAVLRDGPGGSDRIELAAQLGNALLSAGRYEDCVEALRRARQAGRADGDDLHNLATALQMLGAMEEAQLVYREAIARGSKATAASRRQLASIVDFRGAELELEELRRALDQPGIAPLDRAEIHLGLAKALDDIGEYEEAFTHLQAGNQLIRMTIDYSAAKNTAFVDRSIETFTRPMLAERRDWGSTSTRPIFILGMPRSGTTLVEQIICTHPEVHGAGELLAISEIFRGLGKVISPDTGMPRIAAQMTPDLTRKSAETYLATIAALDGQSRFVSDKMPFNFRYLGFISLLFPEARIIHTVRHPLDVGVSCHFARFSDQLQFSFNMSEIGRYTADYQRLMEHWHQVVANEILTVNYDTLIADQEGQTRRLLEFCGLEWDDRCLEFHRTERPVLTASNWQVRQPLYATSVGRWRRYREWLGPMTAALKLADPDGWTAPDRRSDRPVAGAD